MTTALIAVGALALGYVLGRVRPFDQLDTWVWRRMTFGGPWVHSRTQRILTFAAHGLVRPRATVYAWRHRNDPPPTVDPPIRVRRLTPEDQ
jgi:hypothetical protein